MNWTDEGYLLSKNNFDENSIIIEALTLEHGKYTGIVYGGASRKQKRNFQIGNKIQINWRSKNVNKSGYFNIELIKPISPLYFDDKKKSVCILSATSILKILLPERQINKKIYLSFEKMINSLDLNDWINIYVFWEFSLIKLLGYEINLSNINSSNANLNKTFEINNNLSKIPKVLINTESKISKKDISEALNFNKKLLMENFILPNRLKFPLFRNLLESYYN